MGLAATATDPIVGAIRAYDHDPGDRVSYEITSGNTNSYFSIDGLGRIRIDPTGLRVSQDFTLTVTARDSARLSDTATVTVKVTSSPIAKLVLDYDHITTGRKIDSHIEFVNGSGTATSNFTLTVTRPSGQAGGNQGAIGSSNTPATTYTFGTTQVSARVVTGGIAYDFSIPNFRSTTSLPIPSSAIPTDLRTGLSHLTLTSRTSVGSEFVISNGAVPLLIEPNTLSMGESQKGEWGFLPSTTSTSEPNERRFSLSILTTTKTRIDLTSGGRDPILVLEDSSGNAIEWSDDGGAGLNAKIVRELTSGNYTVVASTRWHGGQGLYEITAGSSEEEETDPDGEFTALDQAPFYVEAGSTTDLVPSGRTITSVKWVTFNTTTQTCGTSSITTSTQGTIVCLEVKGTGFQTTDSLLASILTTSDHQPAQVAVGGIGLDYVNNTTMRGRWVAQRLLDYLDGSSNSAYKAVVVGYENGPMASLTVGPAASSGAGGASQDFVAQLVRQLQHLGVSNAEAIVDTLFAVYGGGYDSKAAYAQDFLKGAVQGEFGVDGAQGVGYYAGWMILGFIPGVDILPDLRDAFALQVTKCNGWTWDSWKCRAVAVVEDAVDVVAVVPVWGKIADTAQVGKIVYKLAKSGGSKERIWLLKNGGEIFFRVLFDGRRGYWALPHRGPYGRGIQLEKVLLPSKYPGWTRLDEAAPGNAELVDYGRVRDDVVDVISVKSHELSTVETARQRHSLTSRINDSYTDLRDETTDGLTGILKDRLGLPRSPRYIRQLDLIVDQTPTGDGGIALKRAVCRKVLSDNTTLPALKVWVNTGSPADSFVEWTISKAACAALRPPVNAYP